MKDFERTNGGSSLGLLHFTVKRHRFEHLVEYSGNVGISVYVTSKASVALTTATFRNDGCAKLKAWLSLIRYLGAE